MYNLGYPPDPLATTARQPAPTRSRAAATVGRAASAAAATDATSRASAASYDGPPSCTAAARQ